MESLWHDHLKHIIFKDCIVIFESGMANHNASDRCVCYEEFEEDIVADDFSKRFDDKKRRYELLNLGQLNAGKLQQLGHLAGAQEQPTLCVEWSFDPEPYADETATEYLAWRQKCVEKAGIQ